jgi:hypothetical protein
MTVEPRTREHLETAARNRDIASGLLDPASSIRIQPPPLEWAVVAAFYSAVHYVNAYLWERQRYEPRDHAARQSAVARVPDLRPASASYTNLRDLAFAARYIPGYRLPRRIAEQALRVDLVAVETAVLTALNIAL